MASSFDGISEVERQRLPAVILGGMYQFVALLTPKGEILEVNRAALEGAGHRIEEIRGKPFWTARWWQISEQARQDLQVAIRRAAAGEFVRYEVDVYGEGSGRVPITIDFSLQPIRGESGAVEYLLPEGRNITERKRAEEQVVHQAQELRILNERLKELDRLKTQFIADVNHGFGTPQAEQASALLKAIVDSSDDAIISKDLKGVITSWNNGAERLFGYTAEETVGRPITLLIPADRLAEEAKILEQLKRGERVDHFETIRVRKDGSQLNISLTISPVKDADGRIIGASKVARDITDRILTDKALREYADQLKDADQRKDEFLATLAHELRNPLAPILNAVGLLKRPNLTAEHFQMAREIAESQLNQMVRLVDDLLDISRISRGRIELKKERVTLKSILDQALETSLPHVEAAGHKLSLSLPPGNVYLDGDPLRLAQVLSNLINNACKYSANNGKIEIKAEVEPAREIKGHQRDAANGSGNAVAPAAMKLVLSVKDTGIGIAPEDMPRLFKLFSQVDSGLDRSQGGLGIGLSLVRSLVEQHGGSVEAHSEGLGKGSEFIVRLPTAPAATEESAMRSGGEPVLSIPLRSERILVVDDNKPQAQSLALLLDTMGFDVRSVYTAKSALSILDEFTPQVALIDIGLPDLNGCELARRLRQLPELKGITLIAQSGWGRDVDREAARQAGFDHYLIKPINHRILQTLLSEEFPIRI